MSYCTRRQRLQLLVALGPILVRPVVLVCLAVLVCVASAGPAGAQAGGTAGRWRLVEQTYNGGRFNFAEGAPALWLVVAADGAASVETLAWRAPWPAWTGPDGPAPLVSSRVLAAGPGGLEAEYRVAPAPGDDTEVKVRESCAPLADDRLRCELTIRLAPPGRDAGGFTWTRLYAREAGR